MHSYCYGMDARIKSGHDDFLMRGGVYCGAGAGPGIGAGAGASAAAGAGGAAGSAGKQGIVDIECGLHGVMIQISVWYVNLPFFNSAAK